jgi:hypothetical protein
MKSAERTDIPSVHPDASPACDFGAPDPDIEAS